MFNRRFHDAVQHSLINIQASENRALPASYGPQDAVAFVDMQNFHYFLKDGCRVSATQVHLVNLLRDFGKLHGMPLTEMHFVTGIHSQAQEPQRYDAMMKRIRWLEKQGAHVILIPLVYRKERGTNTLIAHEKGIDVRLGSEIIRAVNQGLQKILVVTQDRDISQAVKVANEIARERGNELKAYSMVLTGAAWEPNGKSGVNGIDFTQKLPIDASFVKKYERENTLTHQHEHAEIHDSNQQQLTSGQA